MTATSNGIGVRPRRAPLWMVVLGALALLLTGCNGDDITAVAESQGGLVCPARYPAPPPGTGVGTVLDTITPTTASGSTLSNMTGVAFACPHLWVASRGETAILLVDALTGDEVRRIPFPPGVTQSTGVEYDGNSLWLGESNTFVIYELDPADGSVRNSFDTAVTAGLTGSYVWGIAFDGSALWLSPFGGAAVYRIDRSTGALISSIPAPNTTGRGVAWDGASVWQAQGNCVATVYKLSASTGTVQASFDATSFLDCPGMDFDGRDLWAGDFSGTEVFRIYIGG